MMVVDRQENETMFGDPEYLRYHIAINPLLIVKIIVFQ